MKHSIVAVLMVIMLALVPAAVLHSTASEPAQAVSVVDCSSVKISPTKVQVTCTAAGVVVLNQTIDIPPGPTVTLPAVTLPPLPGATVTLPGATVTIQAPQETTTLEVPVSGPTQTTTVTAAPGEPETVTVTETITEQSSPSSLPSSTGQVDNEDGTLVPDTNGPSDPVVSIPDIETPAQAAGIGLLALLVLVGLVLLGLYFGYYLGYKDSDRANANFMQALLARVKDR